MPCHAVVHTYQRQAARGGAVEREDLVSLVNRATAAELMMVEG